MTCANGMAHFEKIWKRTISHKIVKRCFGKVPFRIDLVEVWLFIWTVLKWQRWMQMQWHSVYKIPYRRRRPFASKVNLKTKIIAGFNSFSWLNLFSFLVLSPWSVFFFYVNRWLSRRIITLVTWTKSHWLRGNWRDETNVRTKVNCFHDKLNLKRELVVIKVKKKSF